MFCSTLYTSNLCLNKISIAKHLNPYINQLLPEMAFSDNYLTALAKRPASLA